MESHPARPKDQEWYNPPPPEPDPKFLVLPVTADRVLVPVPRAKFDVAISKLANIESVELTRAECEKLAVPFDADQLLENEIREERIEVNRGGWYLTQNRLPARVIDAVTDGIARNNKAIVHWKSLKGHVRPYLVRAVAANYDQEDFGAVLWRGCVTVIHSSTIKNDANDPLHQYAAMGDIAPKGMVKWPVVVYLEAPPAHVFTRIHVLKLGR